MSPPSPCLRILMTADAVGGVWAYSTTLAAALGARGHRVHLVTLGPPPRPEQVRELGATPGVTLEITDLLLEWMDPEGADAPHGRQRLAEIESETAPDVVHLNGYREATVPWCAPALVVAHSCVRSWWRACRGSEPDEPRWRDYGAQVAAGLAAADRWVAPTAAFRDAVQTLYRPPVVGQAIRNGIAPPLGTPAKEPFILAAGRLWDEAKNVAALASIARDLPWPVRLAGDTRSDGNGVDIASGENLHLCGALPHPELLRHMERAAIFAAPALYEPFGLAILEAAARGCALALSDISTLRELWDGAALFFDPRSPAALRHALIRLCGDDALRIRLQAAAVRRARRYSLSRMVAAYEGLYGTMSASRARGSASGARHPLRSGEMAR